MFFIISLLTPFFFRTTFAFEPIVAPEIVVVGKRLHGDHRSARIFTESDLQRESGRTLGEVLREAAGVDYTSGIGGNSNVLIRGSTGSQTLVIIDGVKVNDPAFSGRYFDWSRIDISLVERVEILKGPQAVSYGSDAIGGVVLITTKQGQLGSELTSRASIEGGSEGFLRTNGNVRSALGTALGGEHGVEFQALGRGVFDGGSSAVSRNQAATEGDDSREATLGLALNSRWGRETRSKLVASLRVAEQDNDGGAFDDDPNSVSRNREMRASADLKGKLASGIEWSGLTSYLDTRSAYSDFPDTTHTTGSDQVYIGRSARAEVSVHSSAESFFEWATGVEAIRETARIDSVLFPTTLARDHGESYAAFIESAVPLTSSRVLTLDFGSRLSHFSSFGSHWSGKAGANAKTSEVLEFDLGISTGFKAPSLYSLYAPTYGNADLKPEESLQIELGMTLRPSRSYSLSLRGFKNRTTNRFGYDSSYRGLNIARAEIEGIEIDSEIKLQAGLRLIPSVTYLSTKDVTTGRALSDVAKWKSAVKVVYDFSSDHSATLSLYAKSDRTVAASNEGAAGYFRADLTTRHRLSKTLSLTSRFENLLDRDYQDVRGYRSLSRSFYFGLEFASL
jgi:vitamin B12 transporter